MGTQPRHFKRKFYWVTLKKGLIIKNNPCLFYLFLLKTTFFIVFSDNTAIVFPRLGTDVETNRSEKITPLNVLLKAR